MADLTLAEAQRVIAACLAKSEEIGARMNIAVVDRGGNLIAHVRMDGAFFGSVNVSIDKAWSAAAFRMPTADLQAISKPDGPAWGFANNNGGRVMVFGGGFPVFRDGDVVGAIGVSGGSVEQDEAVAEAGLKALG